MNRPPGDLDVVVVDVETTGWLPEESAITEIGAVRLNGGQVTGEFSTLVRPAWPIPADIIKLTGITEEMVRRAPPAASALPAFLAFASGCVLAAHNAPFDLSFLTSASKSCGIAWPPVAVIDTAVLARMVLTPDQVPDCRLATLASYFGTRTVPCHRALADAKATAEVLLGLFGVLAAAPGGPGARRTHPQARRRSLWALHDQRRLYATGAAGARVPGRRRRRLWSPLSS
jgi:DNA polymerase III subunit epsilon